MYLEQRNEIITLKSCRMEKYFDLLGKCRLFQNIPEGSYDEALRYLRARKQEFTKGEFILHIGDKFHHAGLILEGTIECSYQDTDFNKFNMNHFSTGELFGESMACANVAQSPMQLVAITDCIILFLDYRVLYDTKIEYEYQIQLSVNLLYILSRQNFFLNQKVRILSQKDLRNKILMYLNSLQPDESGFRTLPFSKTALAEFLCVNRTALSREIRRMLDEGVLSMDKRRFIIFPEHKS